MAKAQKKLEDIAPGTSVRVEIIKAPGRLGARKTLERVLGMDAGLRKQRDQFKKLRSRVVKTKQRGGREFNHLPKKRVQLELVPGESGTVLATTRILADLRSVANFVRVTAV